MGAFRRNRSAIMVVLAAVAAVCAFFQASSTFLGPYLHQKTQGTTSDYFADVGYFTDGTSIIKAGNANNHPITATDPHTNGSPLPSSKYAAEVGYFVDGTDVTKAGNMNNR